MTKFPVYMRVVFERRLSMLTNKRDNTKGMMIQHIEHVIDFRRFERIFFIKRTFVMGMMLMQFPSILEPIARDLLWKKIDYPLTIVYVPLKLCGFAYKLFGYVLGTEQYFPHSSATIPENHLFAQFHAPQTSQMKDEIPKQLEHCSGNFCNSCFRNWCGQLQ